jgi:hypothetical protein
LRDAEFLGPQLSETLIRIVMPSTVAHPKYQAVDRATA